MELRSFAGLVVLVASTVCLSSRSGFAEGDPITNTNKPLVIRITNQYPHSIHGTLTTRGDDPIHFRN